jgi:hypothetical protein
VARRRSPHPVLLPSEPPRRGPLPVLVPILALVGLAVAGFYAVPAVVEHQRLEREYAHRERLARDAQELLEQRRQTLRQSGGDTYGRRKRTRELMSQGARYLRERGK